jgi:hypothetical protein
MRDWSKATTFIPESISYNLAILNAFNETFLPIFSVGRYIVINSIRENEWGLAEHTLEFLDIRRNPDLLQQLKTVPRFAYSQDQLTSFLEDYNSRYDSTKDAIELILGAPPAEPLGFLNLN